MCLKDLMEILRKEGIGIVNRCVPYDIRRGKVLGKHIFEKIVSKEERKKIWISYKDRKTSVSFPDGSSLNDYLKVASICYNAAFGEKTKGMDPLQKYKRWADGRHGGMLDIKDPDSKEMFGKWLHSGRMGGHPFEIVFSWFQHGIHLYPPGENFDRVVGQPVERRAARRRRHPQELFMGLVEPPRPQPQDGGGAHGVLVVAVRHHQGRNGSMPTL